MSSSSTSSIKKQLRQQLMSESMHYLKNDKELCETVVSIFLDEQCDLKDVMDSADAILEASCSLSEVNREELLTNCREKVASYRRMLENDDDSEVDDWFVALETKEKKGVCKLCFTTQRITIHHAVPKLILKRMRNGKFTLPDGSTRVNVKDYLLEVCRPCHNQIHKYFPHSECAKTLQTVAQLQQSPELQSYIQWKRKKEGTTEMASQILDSSSSSDDDI